MPTQKQLDEASRLWQQLDQGALLSKTDAEIEAAAKADPDSDLPLQAELDQFELVLPAKARKARKHAAE